MASNENDNQEKCKDDQPRKATWRPGMDLIEWQGFNLLPDVIYSAIPEIETKFKPLESDIILASFPKTGTTWLKALTVSILNHNANLDPLLTHNPHELVPFLELEVFGPTPVWDIKKMSSSPRVFNTHLPYSILPVHIKNSGCRIVYISRNPADTFVSQMHFYNKRFGANISIEDWFDEFCNGFIPAGPFFEHVSEYWSVRDAKNVFFISYEELKQDPVKHVKRLAEFLGYYLDANEIEKVVMKCSIERLSKLDVNNDSTKTHWTGNNFGNFFRRGVVGDSKNYLTRDMEERLNRMVKEKWEMLGLVP